MARSGNTKRKPFRQETNLGAEVIHSLNDFFDALNRGEQVTVRDIRLDLAPAEYKAAEIRDTRAKLGLSQAGFARLLAVNVKTVQSWEQGERPPAGPVRRLLDEINQDPQRWLLRLKQVIRSKAS